MITVHYWQAGASRHELLDSQELMRRREELTATQCVLWIDLADPTSEEERLVFEQFFPVHSLSLEDMTRPRREPASPPHFPKVEEFPDYLFVIVNPLHEDYLATLRANEERPASPRKFLAQLSAVFTEQILITHHYQPLGSIQNLQTFVARHEAQCERGPDFLFHLILDHTVDQFAPVLDFIDDVLEDMEWRVVQRPRIHQFRRLLRLKRQIVLLRKTLIYEREVLVRLSRGEFALISDREAVYYRNVYDHLVRFTELIESSREMTSDLMQSYLASISNRLNEIMKVLTMISTVVLPMTLIAGIYGMNFKNMPELDWPWGYPFALAIMVLMGVAAFVYFKWKKWI